jgi:hypothetical protein
VHRVIVIGLLLGLAGLPALSRAEHLGGRCTAKTKWGLWDNGLCLRGANVWQVLVGDQDPNVLGSGHIGPPYSAAILTELRGWGANFVNLSHPGIFTQTPPYQLDPLTVANLDDWITKLGNAGLFAVISFRTGPGRTENAFSSPSPPDASPVWTSQAAQDAWVEMWRQTAVHFRGNPVVIGYHLMVEPNGNRVGIDEWDPSSFLAKYRGTLYDWNALAARITTAIREVDTDTPILVSAMNWADASWLPSTPVTGDPRTVYVIHQYEPDNYTQQVAPLTLTYPGYFDGNYLGYPQAIDESWLSALAEPAVQFRQDHGVPVAVLEYGVMRWEPGVAQFLRDRLDVLESDTFSHAIWLWETDFAGVDWTDFNFRVDPNPDFIRELKSDWARNTVSFSSPRPPPATALEKEGRRR